MYQMQYLGFWGFGASLVCHLTTPPPKCRNQMACPRTQIPNGVFHTCAQEVYEYGNNKKPPSLLVKRIKIGIKWRRRLFEKICDQIEYYVKTMNPTKRLILCVDGVAGLAKMSQQRQRRYRSAYENQVDDKFSDFDPIGITPGTVFMNYLTK